MQPDIAFLRFQIFDALVRAQLQCMAAALSGRAQLRLADGVRAAGALSCGCEKYLVAGLRRYTRCALLRHAVQAEGMNSFYNWLITDKRRSAGVHLKVHYEGSQLVGKVSRVFGIEVSTFKLSHPSHEPLPES